MRKLTRDTRTLLLAVLTCLGTATSAHPTAANGASHSCEDTRSLYIVKRGDLNGEEMAFLIWGVIFGAVALVMLVVWAGCKKYKKSKQVK